MNEKAIDAFKTISEVSVELNIPQHVLRFWEKKIQIYKTYDAWRWQKTIPSRRRRAFKGNS